MEAVIIKLFGRLSFKIVFIFFLILVALAFNVISSYYAVDTQEQHLLLTELLSKQKLLIEQVVYETSNLSNLAMANEEIYLEKLSQNRGIIEQKMMEVDTLFTAAIDREYILDQDPIQLKFRDEFAVLFDRVLYEAVKEWEKSKNNIAFLLDQQHLEEKETFKKVYTTFQENNRALVMDSDLIVKICRDESKAKKRLSQNIQIASIVFSSFIFIVLVYLLLTNFYNPIQEIKKIFNQMSKGKFNEKFSREKDDEFKELYDNFNHFINNLNTIFTLEDKILKENDLIEIIRFISKEFKLFVPFKYLSVEYIQRNSKKILMKFDETTCIKNEVVSYTVDIEKEKIEQMMVQDRLILLPITINNTYLGKIIFEFETKEEIQTEYLNFLELISYKLSLGVYKSLFLEDLLSIITESLAKMAEYKDTETGEHLIRMGNYSQIIAKKLKEKGLYTDIITDDFINQIRIAAPMHDIGKVGVPDRVLLKPAKLTAEEFTYIEKHPVIGAKILKELHSKFSVYNLNYFKMPYKIANDHHEKWQGTGYPNGKSGEDISLAARIAAIGDVFDALTSKRPYKEAYSLKRSYEIIEEMKGTHLDPTLVEAFFEVKDEIEKVYQKYKD